MSVDFPHVAVVESLVEAPSESAAAAMENQEKKDGAAAAAEPELERGDGKNVE